jgi:hypothetical protein
MNWETYKTLTPELKEEYNFKFQDKLPSFIFDIRKMMSEVSVLLMLLCVSMFLIKYHKQEALIPIIDLIGKIMIPIIVIYLIVISGGVIFRFVTEILWLKKNKIKRVGSKWTN